MASLRRATPALLALAALLLAGCSGGGRDPVEDADFSELGLEASATTGLIRGVVVDEAIRPVAGASVSLRIDGGAPRATQSSAEGLFGFDGLAPGTYFLDVSKPGHAPAQTSADVVAGEVAPQILKVILPVDPETRPFFEFSTWEGYIECSVRTPVVGVALCQDYGNDDVAHDIELANGVPTFAQGELVWESTQALGDELSFNWRRDDTDNDYVDTEGPSPLVLQANRTLLAENEVGEGQPLRTVVFTGHNPATEPPCSPEPVGCPWGVGVQLQQRFTMYAHVFYNAQPPEAWRFTADGDPPMPA